MMTEYGYEVWFDGQCLSETTRYDDWFESEEEANEAACDAVREHIDTWKSDGNWDGETFDDFEIIIKER